MSSDPNTSAIPSSASKTCCAWKVAAALVLLRLCIGWHFFAEGVKKISLDSNSGQWQLEFSAEPFFRLATGPLADQFHSLVPGEHNWQNTLAVPEQLTPESMEDVADWVSGYVKRRQKELASGKHTEVEIPESLPHAAWYKEIDSSRRMLLEEFTSINGLSDEQREQAAAIYERRARQLADYLTEEAIDIQTYRHELWRLGEMRQVPGAVDIPFRSQRIGEKQAETARDPRKWVAVVKNFDEQYKNQLLGLLTQEQIATEVGQRASESLVTKKERDLHRMNWAVTALTLGVGLCLLTGLFTRLASVAGAAFLLSIMATQPPWVPGAITDYFYYQLVEFTALIFLAASGAGRIAGLDFFLDALWSKGRGVKQASN